MLITMINGGHTRPGRGERRVTDRPDTQECQTDKDDVRLIEGIFADLESAFAEHDAAKFDERFTADVVFTAVNGARFLGWEKIHAYHSERLTGHAGGIDTWYEIEHITFPAPDVAVVFPPAHRGVRTQAGQCGNVGAGEERRAVVDLRRQNTGVAVAG
ncbi:SgcJ/EcaC family oxidoreductase [Streptomyces albidoflavus]